MIRIGLLVFCLTAFCAGPLFAADLPHAKPGEKTVYMVLMGHSDMAHVTEMPSMERCRTAIEFVAQAQCIEAVKPLSGDFPPEILELIPDPDDVPE